jgi:hypothetical protein
VAELDGVWGVERTGGALPPLIGVTKEIQGEKGVTRVAGVARLPFDVRGRALHYRGLFRGLVDELEPEGDGFRGRATFRGRPFGTFAMRRRTGP